jgi:hypothetical protein
MLLTDTRRRFSDSRVTQAGESFRIELRSEVSLSGLES